MPLMDDCKQQNLSPLLRGLVPTSCGGMSLVYPPLLCSLSPFPRGGLLWGALVAVSIPNLYMGG